MESKQIAERRSKEIKELAISTGASTDLDYGLFADLLGSRTQFALPEFQEQLAMFPPFRGMLLRYTYLLEQGRFFEPQPLPKGYRRGKAKECYSNSFDLAVSKTELTYCEGMVVVQIGEDRIMTIEHGWCATKDEKVIDVTLRPSGLSYFGVTYTLTQLAKAENFPLYDQVIAKQLHNA